MSLNSVYILNVTNQIMVVLTTISISWTCIKLGLKKTSMHAFLCTTGFLLLLVEAMLTHYNSNVLTKDMSHNKKGELKFFMQLIGGILGILGTLQKSLSKKTHFQTTHGAAGLTTCIFFTLSLISDLMLRYCNFESLSLQRWHHRVDDILDFITLLMGIVTQYYGYKTGYFRRNYVNIGLYKFITIMIYIITILVPLKAAIRKLINFTI